MLLKLLLGLQRVDTCALYVGNAEITRFSERELLPIRRKVGMDFQNGALFDSLSVFGNIERNVVFKALVRYTIKRDDIQRSARMPKKAENTTSANR